jgi:hypothetical protein
MRLTHPLQSSENFESLNLHAYGRFGLQWSFFVQVPRGHATCLVEKFSASHIINTLKNELSVTFVSLGIIMYPAILGVNLPCRFEFSGKVHL